jgi:hypothetical protein
MTSAWLAISLAAVLLSNPGVCAALSFAQAPAHACCPKAPGAPMSKGCANMGCVKPEPVLPPIQVGDDITPSLAPPDGLTLPVEFAAAECGAPVDPLFAPAHRFLSFHQLLI